MRFVRYYLFFLKWYLAIFGAVHLLRNLTDDLGWPRFGGYHVGKQGNKGGALAEERQQGSIIKEKGL